MWYYISKYKKIAIELFLNKNYKIKLKCSYIYLKIKKNKFVILTRREE